MHLKLNFNTMYCIYSLDFSFNCEKNLFLTNINLLGMKWNCSLISEFMVLMLADDNLLLHTIFGHRLYTFVHNMHPFSVPKIVVKMLILIDNMQLLSHEKKTTPFLCFLLCLKLCGLCTTVSSIYSIDPDLKLKLLQDSDWIVI